jgi:hypothetical protein
MQVLNFLTVVGPAGNVFVWQVEKLTNLSLRCSGTRRHVFGEPPGRRWTTNTVSVTVGIAKGFCLLRSVGITQPNRGVKRPGQ